MILGVLAMPKESVGNNLHNARREVITESNSVMPAFLAFNVLT